VGERRRWGSVGSEESREEACVRLRNRAEGGVSSAHQPQYSQVTASTVAKRQQRIADRASTRISSALCALRCVLDQCAVALAATRCLSQPFCSMPHEREVCCASAARISGSIGRGGRRMTAARSLAQPPVHVRTAHPTRGLSRSSHRGWTPLRRRTAACSRGRKRAAQGTRADRRSTAGFESASTSPAGAGATQRHIPHTRAFCCARALPSAPCAIWLRLVGSSRLHD
jgi:hypothetical protein